MNCLKGIGNESGIILVTALLIMGLLSALAAGTLLSGQIDLRISANLKENTRAFYIAEAGLHRAWQEMADADGTDDFATVFSATGTTTLFGNTSFGLQNTLAGVVNAPHNFWGAASGPGADPADEVFDGPQSTTLVDPVATKEFNIRVQARD